MNFDPTKLKFSELIRLMTNEEELLATFPPEFTDPPGFDFDEDEIMAAITARLQLVIAEVDRRIPGPS